MQLYNNNFIQKDITRLKFLSRKKITHANKIPGLFSSFSVFQSQDFPRPVATLIDMSKVL